MAEKQFYSLDRDLKVVEAMASRLKPYVYEAELYGLMPGDYPRLTLGGLLMRLARLPHLPLSPAQQAVLATAHSQLDEIQKEWAVAYEGKIQREVKARILSLNQYLDECPGDPHGCADHYPSAIEKRVMLEALSAEAERLNILSQEMKGGISAVDNKIHRFFDRSDTFVWDAQLIPAYPPDPFWYLYQKSNRRER
ncbi:MAG TPA: hypothetical protein VMT34_00465 [Aggregatilineales bacterium]|nr:hypothetical protein [Aggregatilineales bacterium]